MQLTDALNLSDYELLARTIMAEAGNQRDQDMFAVGNVIMNRLRQGGGTLKNVILSPAQFSPWNTTTLPDGSLLYAAGKDQGRDMGAIKPSAKAYEIADLLLSGEVRDNTGGATHFFNPKISNPKWAEGMSNKTKIGSHVYGRAGDFPSGLPSAGKPLSAIPEVGAGSLLKERNMVMDPNVPQRTGLLGMFDRMRQADPETGLTGFERFGAALDPLLMPEQRMGEQIRARGAQRMATQSRNKTIAELERMAQSDPLANDLLRAVRSGAMSPADAFKALMAQRYNTSKDTIRSTQRFLNGTYYVVTDQGPKVYNPSGKLVGGDEAEKVLAEANKFEIENRALGVGLSEAQKLQQKYASEAFDKAEQLTSSIGNIDAAIASIDSGAKRNLILNQLPDITSQSAQLTSALRRMGLDVVSSVTFGALSEAELNIAMATAYPPNATEQELRKFLVDRKNALIKLRKYTEEAAMFLNNPNNTRADWMQIVKERRDQTAASSVGNPYMNMTVPELNEVYLRYNSLSEAQKNQFMEALRSKQQSGG